MEDNKNQTGNILLYTLLILAAIMAAVLIITRILRQQIRIVTDIDNSVAAFYAADSGAEQALYSVRKLDVLPTDGNCGLTEVDCTRSVLVDAIDVLTFDLDKDQSMQFDFYNPEDISQSTDVNSMKFDWSGPGSWIEVSYVQWEPNATINWQDNSVQKRLYGCCTAIINDFDTNKAYRARVKALYNNIDDMSVQVYPQDDASGTPLAFPNYIRITNRGKFARSNQSVQIDMNREKPILGLFDYVLYSEGPIEK